MAMLVSLDATQPEKLTKVMIKDANVKDLKEFASVI